MYVPGRPIPHISAEETRKTQAQWKKFDAGEPWYPTTMTPEEEQALRQFDLMAFIEKACQKLSYRRKETGGRFYKREVELMMVDDLGPILLQVLATSKEFVHCYEGEPNLNNKPHQYRPRDVVGFDSETQK
jgi:hypothetical protein